MVRVTEELALSAEHVALYHTTDPLLGHLPLLIFHGPSTTANYTLNSSRVQVHVFSPAGFQSFPRLTISPNSPFYAVVNHLPREFQGDEIYRALAFGLLKYFTELPEVVKNHLKNQYPTTRGRRPGSAPALFGEQHAADLAKSMVKSEQTADIVQVLQAALQTQHVGNVDVDLVLPPGSVIPLKESDLEDVPEDEDDILDPTLRQYVGYSPLVKLFGEPVFVPTSRLRRAPSKPTSLNRSRSFSKDQKLDLRFKMGELVDTEERYVLKLIELVRHIADDFRQSAKSRAPGSTSPSAEDVEELFPRSADTILQINTAFMQELRKVMDDSEEEALKDMEVQTSGTRIGGSLKMKDPSGALAMARAFIEWFPKFTDCYQDYIRASQNFPQLLNSFLDQQSSFRQRVNQRGEQNIRSALIEPVQRLPRYSLFIDQIVNCLPITHPALQPMLRARDIITNICSMDDPMPDKPHIAGRLRSMVESWPLDLEPGGRLIAAVDFAELAAPFHLEGTSNLDVNDRRGMFLLFPDCLVLLKKKGHTNLAGRDFLREIDKPSAAGLLAAMTNAAGGQASYDLAFAGWHKLADVRFTESADGQLIWMTSTQEMLGAHSSVYVSSTAVTSRCFSLQESYEGKASRWGEEVVKARVEGRFPEAEREDPCWSLRSVRMPDSNLGLFTAVFQEGADQLVPARREPAAIRIVVDYERGTKGAPVGHYGVEIVINIRAPDMKRLSMETSGLQGKLFTDEVAIEDLLPTISRRIIQLLSSQFNTANLRLAASLVSYDTKILRGLNFSTRAEKTRSFLATSPVKLLSSFLGGGSVSENTFNAQPKLQRTPLGNVATLFPAQPPPPPANQGWFGSGRNRDGGRIAMDETRPENPLVRLEQTFTGYIASLQAKRGTIASRMLLNRSSTDELSVNDLYNRLIESPFDLDASADLGADVVFAAFEKFLRIAWRDQMGPIITKQALNALQERAVKRVPGDFADFVNFLFADMAPQNRRAFTAVIRLLADLLDGCGNDGDRGAMTLAFAELLVNDGTAQYYINLLDRLVEDCDRIFDEAGFGSGAHLSSSAYESLNSTARSTKSASGSLTSNTSSLRRKLGFDNLLRQNSKTEPDTRPSMWRSLSKHGRHGDVSSLSSSLSKASGRSRTFDVASQSMGPNKLRRPASRDGPPLSAGFDEIQRPASSHKLETIGEPELPENSAPLSSTRRKRRSSLSDLKNLMAAATLEDSPLMPLRINKQTAEKFNSGPRVPPPSRIPVSPTTQQNLRSSRQKENIPAPDPFHASQHSLVATDDEKPMEKVHSKSLSVSGIPVLKPPQRTDGLASSTGGESPSRPSSSPTRQPQKFKLQSPQKLREKLQAEKTAVEEADASLKGELARIVDDLARLNAATTSGGSNTAATGGSTSALPRSAATPDLRKLMASVRALEEKVPVLTDELRDRQTTLQREMESTVRATEAKVKAIDQLFKETTAENEIWYDKFNSELAKIVKALKGKGREDKEELVVKLKEQSEETARVRKENARLKREMVGLRTALKAATGP